MPREWNRDEEGTAFDRRGLLKLGAAGAAVLGVSALVERKGAAGTKSPFDAPFPTDPDGSARSVRTRVTAPPPATIVSRVEWRANERLRSRAIDFDRTVTKIVVHHTGTSNHVRDWPGQVRAIYRNSTAHGYRDMPYHWLIDPNGSVYEGRWARRVPAGTIPNGEDDDHRSVRGGHARHHNTQTLGVALLGTFDTHPPTPLAFDALVALITWKAARWGIDPHGASRYRLYDGGTQVFPNICAHRRVVATDCPGRIVNTMLPWLRTAVAKRLA